MRDDELLRRYLLGELSDEDAAHLEARLIQDGDLFERAEALEADLLEEHAHGGLSTAQRARIRRHLASSEASRSQMAMVRGLGTVTREKRVLTGPWGGKELSRPWVRALAAAAMLAIAVPSAWLALQTARLPEERERIVEGTPTPTPLPISTPVPLEETPVQDRIVELEPTPEPEPTAAPEPAPFVFQLALTAFRGPDDGVKELRIPAGTEEVAIHLPLNSEDEAYPSFQVVLRDAAGTELIRRTDLQPVKAGDTAVLILPVEAKVLAPGRYSVEVYGDGDNALGFPEFEVPEP